jgi:hypothetical protein
MLIMRLPRAGELDAIFRRWAWNDRQRLAEGLGDITRGSKYDHRRDDA